MNSHARNFNTTDITVVSYLPIPSTHFQPTTFTNTNSEIFQKILNS